MSPREQTFVKSPPGVPHWVTCFKVCSGSCYSNIGTALKNHILTKVSKLGAVKEILTFIFAIFIQMTTPAFGNNFLHIKFTKVSVNIKVQRICLPFRAHIF